MAELRAAGKGRLSDAALVDLGWSADQARQVIAALKTVRAQMPDKPGRPVAIPHSPFAALAVLTEAPAAPRKRRRPRRKARA